MDAHKTRRRQRLRLLKRKQNSPEHIPTQDNANDSLQGMMVFGYSARIFSGNEIPPSSRVDLIPLEQRNMQGATLRVDRYDIRHLLSLPDTGESNTSDDISEHGKLDSLRFATLRSFGENGTIQEAELFSMDPEERHAYIDVLSHPDEQGGPARRQEPHIPPGGVSLQYDASGIPTSVPVPKNGDDSNTENPGENTADAKSFVPSFAIPEGVATPKSQRHFEIIERTARFLSEQQDAEKAAQMEIMIQGKQGTNADFEFLNRTSQLHPFYKNILWLMRTGLYGYNGGSSSEEDTEPEVSNDTGNAPQSVQANIKAEDQESRAIDSYNVPVPDGVIVPADPNTRSLVDKVACLVGKSPLPPKLEQKLRVEKATTSTRYAFLSPFDATNKYYCFRRDCYINGADEDAVEAAVFKALKEAQAPPAAEPPHEAKSTALVQLKRRMLALEFLKAKRAKSGEK
ncbi:hypothetical protein LPJ81_003026 [Coemansia sp. IMI 209127]|nr:hypothetical protein LPJ81_003026 [Coemansia sp. IMI 209127]